MGVFLQPKVKVNTAPVLALEPNFGPSGPAHFDKKNSPEAGEKRESGCMLLKLQAYNLIQSQGVSFKTTELEQGEPPWGPSAAQPSRKAFIRGQPVVS